MTITKKGMLWLLLGEVFFAWLTALKPAREKQPASPAPKS